MKIKSLNTDLLKIEHVCSLGECKFLERVDEDLHVLVAADHEVFNLRFGI